MKAIVATRTNDLPPRTHNLTRLAELAELQLNDKDSDFIAPDCRPGTFSRDIPVEWPSCRAQSVGNNRSWCWGRRRRCFDGCNQR
ncbi:MAG: hypothetical protein HYR83_11650 [Planctomycetes bacterium]|nr:hypothetical protein [Planctomycetota bacterium]